MAISTGSVNLPAATANTHGLDTTRTAIVRAKIRADIEPRTQPWQFEFQPWHYWTAITSTVVVTVGFVVIAVIGMHR